MNLFAALVWLDSSARAAPSEVLAALSGVYGASVASRILPGCTMLAASPSPGLHDALVEDHATPTIAAGTAVIEGRSSLVRELALPDAASALSVCAAAVGRWQEGATRRLCGEFAFATWDPFERWLLCARDGLGTRQLFVARSGAAIIVTNVLAAAGALDGVPGDLDEHAIAHFAATGELPPDRTAYRAIRPVPPGHTLTVKRGRAALHRHWEFPQPAGRPLRSRVEAVEGYRRVLEAAVADRLTPSGTAVLLSGGIDSTTITAAATAVGAVGLHAFTIRYRRVPTGSELSRARSTAHALRVPNTTVCGDTDLPLAHLVGGCVTRQPMDEPALTDWRRVLGAAASHSRTVLYGEDGDALFAPPGGRALLTAVRPADLARDVSNFWRATWTFPYLGLRCRERLRRRRRSARWTLGRGWLTADALRLLEDRAAPRLLDELAPAPEAPHPTRPEMHRRLRRGIPGYLAGIMTPEVTGHPLELRCPLLDTRVLRFVVNVAPIPWCQHKLLARTAYADVLPREVWSHPKVGVDGLDRALGRIWWQHQTALPFPEELEGLIESTAWNQAVAGRVEPWPLWRLLQLAAWLRSSEAGRSVGDRACTA